MGRRKIQPGEIRHAYNVRVTDETRLERITNRFKSLREKTNQNNQYILEEALKRYDEAI